MDVGGCWRSCDETPRPPPPPSLSLQTWVYDAAGDKANMTQHHKDACTLLWYAPRGCSLKG